MEKITTFSIFYIYFTSLSLLYFKKLYAITASTTAIAKYVIFNPVCGSSLSAIDSSGLGSSTGGTSSFGSL